MVGADSAPLSHREWEIEVLMACSKITEKWLCWGAAPAARKTHALKVVAFEGVLHLHCVFIRQDVLIPPLVCLSPKLPGTTQPTL